MANGSALLAPEGDARGWWARRFGEVVSLRLDDLGDAATLSESQVSLSKRAAALEVSLEADEAAMSRGDDVNLKTYAEVAGQLTRILVALGLKRVPRAALTLAQRAMAADREVSSMSFRDSPHPLQFFGLLKWIDGRPLMDTIEPYPARDPVPRPL